MAMATLSALDSFRAQYSLQGIDPEEDAVAFTGALESAYDDLFDGDSESRAAHESFADKEILRGPFGMDGVYKVLHWVFTNCGLERPMHGFEAETFENVVAGITTWVNLR